MAWGELVELSSKRTVMPSGDTSGQGERGLLAAISVTTQVIATLAYAGEGFMVMEAAVKTERVA